MQAVETYLDLLGTLVQHHVNKELSQDRFKEVLRINLQNLWKKLKENEAIKACVENEDLLSVHEHEGGGDADILWEYAQCTMKILHLLRDSMVTAASMEGTQINECKRSTTAPPLPADVLGAVQQNTVMYAFQLLTVLVVSPNLSPGVGVPLSLRSGVASVLVPSASASSLSWYEKQGRLALCSRVLLGCVDQPNLGSLVLSRCLGDLLASLMQLRYAPVPKQEAAKEVSPEIQAKLDAERKKFRVFSDGALKKILGNVYPPLVVRELMLLQSGPPPQLKKKFSASPLWLRKHCSRALTNILVGSNKGVQFVLKGMLDHKPEVSSSEWQKCDAAAKVIANCPLHNQMSAEEYFAKVAPQLIDLLHISDKVMARQYERVAVSTMNAMYLAQPALTQRYVLLPILHPLMLCCSQETSAEGSEDEVIVCDKALGQCIADLHVIIRFPSSPLLLCLQPVLHPLYKLYEFTSLSLLTPLAHMILLTFFRSVDAPVAVRCLRFLVMEETMMVVEQEEVGPKVGIQEISTSDATSTSSTSPPPPTTPVPAPAPAPSPSPRWMNSSLCFVMAASGGAMVKRRMDSGQPDNIEATAVKLVTLIKDVNRDDIVAEFFLYLLEKLGELLVEETEKSGGVVIPGLCAPSQADMARLQHNLLQLMLLATLCDQLPDTCFTNTPHILRFAKITLERAIYILERSDDEDMGMFESETITMAMGLLTAVLGGAAPISTGDRVATQELLPLLDKLSTRHPEPTVQEMATDIRIAIATQGLVLSDVLKAERARSKKPVVKSKPPKAEKKKILVEELPDLLPKSKTESENPKSRKLSLSDSGVDDTVVKSRKSSLSADSGLEDNTSSDGSVMMMKDEKRVSESKGLKRKNEASCQNTQPQIGVGSQGMRAGITELSSRMLNVGAEQSTAKPKTVAQKGSSSTAVSAGHKTSSKAPEKPVRKMKLEPVDLDTKALGDFPKKLNESEQEMKGHNVGLDSEAGGVSEREGTELGQQMGVKSELGAAKSELGKAASVIGQEERELQQAEGQLEKGASGKESTELEPTAPAQLSTDLSQAYQELLDPLVPVRGHALITLRRLVEKNDTAAMDQKDTLLRIFRENLDHGDSYIYMGAIQGLAALGTRDVTKVLPVIVEEYGSTVEKRSPELRLKLGEVMMKTCRAHGELMGDWRELLLNSILCVLRTEKDELVRASAVSNLAELCRLLRFSLAGVLWEVMECVSSLLKCDKAPQVRQGAAMLITMLLQGLGQDAFKVLDSALKELYTLLKQSLQVEKEDAVKLHVRLALDEMDTIMRTFLFPKPSMQKTINILNVPDNSIL